MFYKNKLNLWKGHESALNSDEKAIGKLFLGWEHDRV